jgi:hypothetical protein
MLAAHQFLADLATLVAVIARSQIVVAWPEPAAPRAVLPRLPEGFEDIDVAVLEWIAAEGRRSGRHFVHM